MLILFLLIYQENHILIIIFELLPVIKTQGIFLNILSSVNLLKTASFSITKINFEFIDSTDNSFGINP
jgi:hypothetical protein